MFLLSSKKNLIAREEKDRYEEYSGNNEHLLTGREYMDPEGKNSRETLRIAEKLRISHLFGKSHPLLLKW